MNTTRLRDRIDIKLDQLQVAVAKRIEEKASEHDETYEFFMRGTMSGIRGAKELVFDAIEEEEFVEDD